MPDEIIPEEIEIDDKAVDDAAKDLKTAEPENPPEVPEVIEEIKPETRKEAKQEEIIDDEDEEIDPDDKKRISKVVTKQIQPLEQKSREMEDRIEVEDFIAIRPEARQYRAKILAYMKSPAYNNIPVQNLYKMVAGDDLMKLGAEKERQAREAAAATQTPSSTARPVASTAKDWSKATSQDVAAMKAKIFGQN